MLQNKEQSNNFPCIYRIVCLKTGFYYIGSTKRPYREKAVNGRYFDGRFNQHKRRFRKGNHIQHLQASWDRNGSTAISFEILKSFEKSITSKQLLVEEQKFLDKHLKNKKCVNVSNKASKPTQPQNYKHSQKTKSKIRKSLSNHFVKNETRRKISASLLGKKHSLKTRNKISRTLSKRRLTKEHCRKISNSKKGNKNPMFQKRGADSPASKRQPFEVIHKESGQSYKFDFIFEAVECLGLTRENLIATLGGRRKTVNGYYARFC